MSGTHTAQDDPGWPSGRRILALLVMFWLALVPRWPGPGSRGVGPSRALNPGCSRHSLRAALYASPDDELEAPPTA